MAFVQIVSMIITSLIIFSTIPSTTSIAPDAPTMILIDGICLNTVNAYYCEQSIIAKLESPHAEIAAIVKIASFNALFISKATTSLIRDEFLPKADKPMDKSQLRTCLGTYNGLNNLLNGAYQAVLRNDYKEMRRYQSYVLGLLDKCKTSYDPMVRKNWWVKLMINTFLVAARRLPAIL